MALKALIKTLDEVDEALHGEYRALADDAGFVLDVVETDGYAMENLTGLRNTLQTQKSQIQGFKDKNVLWGDLDPNDVKGKLTKLTQLESIDPDAEVSEKVKTALATHKAQFETALGDKDISIGELNKAIESLLVDSTAISALAEAKGEAKLLLPHIKTQCKVVKTDTGEYAVNVLDHNGNARIAIANGQTRDFTIGDLVEEMRADDTFGRAFEAQSKSGTGGPSDHRRTTNGDGTRVLDSASHDSISGNLADIAEGKATVADM